MLHNILNLSKVFLISAFHRSSGKKKRKGRIILYVFLFLYVAAMLSFLSYELIDSLISLHQEEAFLGLIFMAIISLTMLTSIVASINLFYFSKDNLFILPLPFRPEEVLAARFNTLLIYSYLEEAMLGLAPLILYGIMCRQGLLYYLFLFPVFLLLPIIPLLITAMLVVCFMALTGGIKNKNLVQIFITSLTIVFSLSISMLSSSMSSQQEAMAMLDKANGLAQLYAKAFPSMPLAMAAMTKFSFLSLLGLAAVSLVAYVLVCFFGHKLYYKGMLGSLFSSSGVSERKLGENAFRTKGRYVSYFSKECKTYLRRPTFFTQLVLPAVLMPPVMLLVFRISLRSGGAEVADLLAMVYETKRFAPYIVAVLLLISMFNASYCFLSIVAVSKDGRDACVMKYIPMSFSDQLYTKAAVDVSLCLLNFLITMILSAAIFKVPVIYVLMILPEALLYSLSHGWLIILDARHPKLGWSAEIEIAKNNLMMMAVFAFTLVHMALIALMAFLLNMNAVTIVVLISFFDLLVCISGYAYIRKEDLKLAENIE
ncbi:MAG: hypothetical protein K5648_05725 [Erysipelotrichaceae bacterium]|nr:hypothetical protein [Erysipelotrichaceae bacterium]